MFENASAAPNILLVRRGKSAAVRKAVDMDRLPDKTSPPEESLWRPFPPQADKPWFILSSIEQSIMHKMESIGTPLKEWNVKINFGIKTSYNEAFVIDNETKKRLAATDPKSAEIVKPMLRGRDIRRYQANWAKLWLIDIHNGCDAIPAVDIDDYPAVKN